MKKTPRDEQGRFVSRHCPECGNGTLQPEDDLWRCDGLVDPENENAALQACDYVVE